MSRVECLMSLYTFVEILTMNSNLPKATQIFKCFPSFKCQIASLIISDVNPIF